MKRIITTIFLLYSYLFAGAQMKQIIPSVNVDAFVGTWEYASESDTFRIVLRKGLCESDEYIHEAVYGGYIYIQNGAVIDNYLHTVADIYHEQMPIKAFSFESQETNSLTLIFTDIRKKGIKHPEPKRTFSNSFTLLEGTKGKHVRWELKEDEFLALMVDGQAIDLTEQGFSVPIDVVMTKIENSASYSTIAGIF